MRIGISGLAALTLSALIMPHFVSAQDDSLPQYRVEIVVFRHLNPSLYGDELVVPDEPVEETLESEPVQYGHFQRAIDDDLQLTKTFEWMQTASNYSPLLHMAWIQPGYARENAMPVAVSGNARGWSVSGDVVLSLERFLRLNLNLKLVGEGDAAFRLEEGRKMRSRTLHYFDHPRFGAIAVIQPVG